MSKRRIPSTRGTDEPPGPAAREENPFDDEGVTAILDAAWDDLQS
ncbi:hypothetical protein [Haloarcula onubensis]|nr:hypothetical protein [Halomicroarcula sp. S3CR25-11]